jgi:hypothetical protein
LSLDDVFQMKDLEEGILRYPDLTPDQQDAVAANASDDPERAALLDQIRALERLFEQARALRALPDAAASEIGASADGAAADEALAFFRATPREALPPALRDDFDRVAAALDEADRGSALRQRYAALTRRLRTLDRQSTDARAHFAALTGHDLASSHPDSPSPRDTSEETGGYAHPDDGPPDRRVEEPSRARATEARREDRREADRDAEERRTPGGRLWRPAAWPKAVRYAGAAVLAVVVLYGTLRATSRFSQSQMERLASVEGERLRVEGYTGGGLRLRDGGAASPSASADSSSLDQRYLRALRTLRAAQSTTLGLLPRYDAEGLRRAERRLEAVVADAEAGSFLQLEALFFLGKARLGLGNKAGATRALRRVAADGGRLTPEAQDILKTLYEDAAYDGTPPE